MVIYIGSKVCYYYESAVYITTNLNSSKNSIKNMDILNNKVFENHVVLFCVKFNWIY